MIDEKNDIFTIFIHKVLGVFEIKLAITMENVQTLYRVRHDLSNTENILLFGLLHFLTHSNGQLFALRRVLAS